MSIKRGMTLSVRAGAYAHNDKIKFDNGQKPPVTKPVAGTGKSTSTTKE